MYFVLNNIRSAWNVGSIFRTAEAVGAKIILIGYTPKPVGATLKQIIKTSIGAEKTVEWEHVDHWRDVLEKYSTENNTHLAIEISDNSQLIFDYLTENQTSSQEVFLWFGNEISGLEKDLVSELKAELHLPMKGMKESLNVSSTVCTVAYLFEYSSTL
jgi:23S rRNA (guanosine2251-2'-O)-methyltransferase